MDRPDEGGRVLFELLFVEGNLPDRGVDDGRLVDSELDFAPLDLPDRLADLRSTDLASNGLARGYYWTAAFHDLRAIAGRELAVARRSGDPQRLGWPTFWLGQAAIQLADWRESVKVDLGRKDVTISYDDARVGHDNIVTAIQGEGYEVAGVAG